VQADRFEQVVIGQGHEAAIEVPFLAHQNGIDYRLQIVVNHPLGHATKEGKGPVVGIEHHLLRFAGIADDKHLPAIRQPEVGHLDAQRHTTDLHVFLAPVKLASITGCKHQRDKGFLDTRLGLCRFPLFHEALHAVVGTSITLGLQAFKEPLGSAALRFGELTLCVQPTFQYRPESPQLRHRLMRTKIDHFALGSQVLAHRRAGQLQIARNRTDALATDQMTAPDFGYDFHG
jgi:hypothetical protein